jgi:hypothetical protein
VQQLAITLRPRTVEEYRSCARGFLAYLHTHFPRIRKLSQLRRDPHLLGWFRYLCQQQPPLRNATRELNLILLRRLLRDLTNSGHRLPPDLIRREDFPFRDHYLPRRFPRTRISVSNNSFGKATPWRPRLSASYALPESVSGNVWIFAWIACSRSVNRKRRSTCRWASSIPNVGYQSMRRRGACWHDSSNYGLSPPPHAMPLPSSISSAFCAMRA